MQTEPAEHAPIPDLLSVGEAARIANVSRETVQRAVDSGALPGLHTGAGRVMFRTHVMAWAAARAAVPEVRGRRRPRSAPDDGNTA
jgi:excisionase family DNA binding protein